MTGLPEAVVLFGASGFLGRNMLDALADRVPMVVAVNGSGEPVPGCAATARLADVDSLPVLPPDTVVIDVAAHRYDARRFRDEQSVILQVNAHIAASVYRFCVERGLTEVRQASSVAVYPADWAVQDDTQDLDLNAPPHAGEAAYAWSKRFAEICAEIHRDRFGISTLTFRLTNPYGPHDSIDLEAAHVVPAFLVRALGPDPSFTIRGNADAERDFVFAGDVADVFVRTLGVRGQHERFNLAFGETRSIRELAAAVLQAVGVEKPIVASDGTKDGVAVRRATASKLREAFDLRPFRTLDEGLALSVDWYGRALADSG